MTGEKKETRIETLGCQLRAGYEVRPVECRVEMNHKTGFKRYFSRDDAAGAVVLATEPMTPADYQADLLAAEACFESKESVEIFPTIGNDSGGLVIAQMRARWYAALRVQIGTQRLTERLDSEQPAFKNRLDAVKGAAKRLRQWLGNLMPEAAEGFEAAIRKLIETQEGRVE